MEVRMGAFDPAVERDNFFSDAYICEAETPHEGHECFVDLQIPEMVAEKVGFFVY